MPDDSPRPRPPLPRPALTGTYIDKLPSHCTCKKFAYSTEAQAQAAADAVQADTNVPYEVYRCSGRNVWHKTTKDAGPSSLRTRARLAAYYLYHRAPNGISVVDLWDLCRIGTTLFDKPAMFRKAVNILYDLRLVRLDPTDPTRLIVTHPDRIRRLYVVGEASYRLERNLLDTEKRSFLPLDAAYTLIDVTDACRRITAGDPEFTEIVRSVSIALLEQGTLNPGKLSGSYSRREIGRRMFAAYLKAGWAVPSWPPAGGDAPITVVNPAAIRAFITGTGPTPWENSDFPEANLGIG